MIRLDTHAALWLYIGETHRFSPAGIAAIDAEELVVSPVVELELTYLRDIGRLTVNGLSIMADLRARVDVRPSTLSLAAIVAVAHGLDWTRDPFDRLIVADAMAAGCPLLTKDRIITEHCALARW